MASASSLAHFSSPSSAEKGIETLEIDPQFAQGLGFGSDDVVRTNSDARMSKFSQPILKVEIGLLHDLGYAKSIGTEPLTADDWEILVGLHLITPNKVDPSPVSGIARFPRRGEPDFSGQGCQHWPRDRCLGTGTH
jgi:hypothetical protein